MFQSPTNKKMGTIIELSDMLKDLNRSKGKVRPTLVPNFEKAGFFTCGKEKDRSFIDMVMKKGVKSIAPNHYKRSDFNLFTTNEK